MDVTWLRGPAGRDVLRRAAELLAADPDRAAVALRGYEDDPDHASTALTQARLRAAAAAKFGDDAAALLLTRDGLEQASRDVVAARRAERLRAAGTETAVDLCCGIGADAFWLARNGIDVLAVDIDPVVAQLADANVDALGLGDRVRVRCADALATDLDGIDAAFADPARRANGRRVFDPDRYSPPLHRLWTATDGVANRVVKVGPGIDHAVIPPDAEAEWVSVGGSVVEAALWRGEVASVRRRASVLTGDDAFELTGDGSRRAPVGEVGEFLYEPDGAVIRAHLVAELAEATGARLAHPDIAYLYHDRLVETPFARAYRVLETLPFHVKRLRELVRRKRIGRLTVKKRGADVVPDRLRRDLRPAGDNEATLIVTRVGDRHTALLCEPVDVHCISHPGANAPISSDITARLRHEAKMNHLILEKEHAHGQRDTKR